MIRIKESTNNTWFDIIVKFVINNGTIVQEGAELIINYILENNDGDDIGKIAKEDYVGIAGKPMSNNDIKKENNILFSVQGNDPFTKNHWKQYKI